MDARPADTPSPGVGTRRVPGPPSSRRADLYDVLQDDGQMLAVRLIRLLHRMAERSGMNPTDFQCYTLLRVSGPMTPGEIADSLCLSTGSVTGVIDRLEAHGLVERARHTGDRRKVTVQLAEGADRIASETAPGMRHAMTALHDDYSVEELATIVGWLDRLGGVLDLLTEPRS
ncbi:MarR family winged helix-turn-helix transcriptional regulator [Nocardiopsis algeriensis]|uniref:DNA-binding MarR family transcriptional regulator n=1 Tax=Nocardiopsis algeriensis TaxID=1478215 RepID=A0A841IKU9_9ACTN|nr:DNA-binding MarR family transcriptional regulator [Nocardiopsis algeriensis]